MSCIKQFLCYDTQKKPNKKPIFPHFNSLYETLRGFVSRLIWLTVANTNARQSSSVEKHLTKSKNYESVSDLVVLLKMISLETLFYPCLCPDFLVTPIFQNAFSTKQLLWNNPHWTISLCWKSIESKLLYSLYSI